MSTTLIWLGHGTWSILADGCRILLDPFLNDNPSSPLRAEQAEADYILVSHGHFDHIADAAVIALRTGATVISNYEICQWLAKQKVQHTEPMNLGGAITTRFGRVKSTLAHHSSELPDGSYGGNPGGFLLQLAAGNIYFACDTGLFDDMRRIGEVGLALAVLPIGDRFTMGPDDAVEAVKLLRPKRVAPAHYNTWPPIAQDAQAWAQQVRKQTSAEPIVLEPGGRIEFP